MTAIQLTVNKKEYTLEAIPGETLSSLLRNRLHLTGTKIGCGEAECGACTVLVDGEPVISCVYPAERTNGREVVTIEGLAERVEEQIRLHPLQEAFILHGAVQCGFCIPGQIMTAYAFLKQNPDPTKEQIQFALKDTLCRCAGYPSIMNAILAAAEALRTGEPVKKPKVAESIHTHKAVGRVNLRPDAVEKVTGEAIFTDDLQFEGMLYASIRRAMVPHAILKRLDISRAKKMPGVLSILTAEDIPGERTHGLVVFDWPVMVGIGERIRYIGDALAIVAAQTQSEALAAAEIIEVEFDLQPVITNPVDARREDSPRLHDRGNLLKHIKVRKGDIEQGFRESEVILEHTFHTQITDHAFLEPECSVAVPKSDGRMEIYVGSQIPYQDRDQVARVMGWPKERVRIIGQLMGGGFGGKEDVMGQIHAAMLAEATGRPVKLLFDRQESLLVHPKRHATQIRVKIGARLDGRLVAAETELYGDTGAYASLGEKVMTRATTHSAGPYDIPHVRADCYAMYTNNPPAGAFRGFGVTQSAFAIESVMDMLAEKLKIDPILLRKMNALQVGSVTNTGQILRESVGLNECIEKVEAEIQRDDPDPFQPKIDAQNPHLVTAWGFAAAYKNTGLGGGAPDVSTAEIELLEAGDFEIRCSSAEMGQGLVTVMRSITAEELNVTPDQVLVLVMDTDLTPNGGPTTASRQTFVTGNACRYAAISLRDAITAYLAEKFDTRPEEVIFTQNGVEVKGEVHPSSEIRMQMTTDGQTPKVTYEYHAPETKPLGTGGDMHFAFSFGVQAAKVVVNKVTGEVRVLKVISANDVGMAVNPLGLQGQIEGGVMMGLGNCLTEEFIVEEGIVVTDRLSKYRVPGIMLTPEIKAIVVEHPISTGPYGAKGVGEICSIPTSPAITNAIYNAVGVRFDKLPVDQEYIARTVWERENPSAAFGG
jgi:xanthine dehydrogenase molybdenum-binding subunit